MEKDIEDTLSNEVLKKTKEVIMKHVEKDVFKQYEPKIYKRREYGGLDDPDTIIGTVDNMELNVEDIADFASGYGTFNRGRGLARLVNDGEGKSGFYYDYDGIFTQERPFWDNAEDEITSSDIIENALGNGLKKRGYDVR